MEPENYQPEVEQTQTSQFTQVTPLSKYLAMAGFILLPFAGGYVGYMYAPEKVVEVEKEVIREVEVERIVETPIISEDEWSISSTNYSKHPTVGNEAFISGPDVIKADEEYVWTLTIPTRLLPTLPEVMWGDETKDGCDLGCSGLAWRFDSEGVTEMKHTYQESGEYKITVYINGSADDFMEGTVILNKTVTVE